MFESLEVKVQCTFGFVQYTIDDNPAYPLSFSKESHWIDLKTENGKIYIPDFHGNSDNPRLYKYLGYKGNDEIKKWIASEDFPEIQSESFKEQTEFYTKLIEQKNQYETCCPEYIERATNFLKLEKGDLNSIDDLGIELFYKQIKIELKGRLSNGQEFRNVIIEK